PVEILGGPGAAPGRFSNPWGVALDSKGNLYVADAMNHRVQKFIRRHGARAQGKAIVRDPWSVATGAHFDTTNTAAEEVLSLSSLKGGESREQPATDSGQRTTNN